MRRIGLSNILHKCFSQLLMKKEKGEQCHKSYQDILEHWGHNLQRFQAQECTNFEYIGGRMFTWASNICN